MVTTVQFTAPRTVTAKNGAVLPAQINQRTELNAIPVALAVYHRINERRVSWDTLMQLGDAMRDSSGVIVMYIALDGEQSARCLWPTAIGLTKDNNITCKAYCTLRREVKTFRVDRMLTAHALTTPDDVIPEPQA